MLIGASALLIAASAIALVFGWLGANSSLIWTSIVATVAAAVTLSLAYFRSRGEAGAAADTARPEGPPPDTSPVPAVAAQGSTDDVVTVADTKKYHRLDCRYASARNTERMPKSGAQRRGYSPCGVCKP